MNTLGKVLVFVVIAIFFAGCRSNSAKTEYEPMSVAEMASANQANLAQLSLGMSKDQVLSVMGSATAKTRDGIVNNPWSAEAFSAHDGQALEILRYVTKKPQPFTPVRKTLTTAVVLKSGKLVAWGVGADAQFR